MERALVRRGLRQAAGEPEKDRDGASAATKAMPIAAAPARLMQARGGRTTAARRDGEKRPEGG